MLEIIVPENEFYDVQQNRFIFVPACTLTLEHSLISIAKWESKWHIPYLTDKKKTVEQEMDYIRCMIVTPIKDLQILSSFTKQNIRDIRAYIEDPMTATTFSKSTQPASKRVITAEVLYSRMFASNIPMECQKWHLNRLVTLLKACDILNNSNPSKMSKQQTIAYNARQNAMRRAKHNTKG